VSLGFGRSASSAVDVKDIVWTETLKDELRNIEKEGTPRSFRVSRLHMQVLTKKYYGGFVSNVMQQRDFNEIMVGCNPFLDWPTMYKRLLQCKGVWAGDIGSYDGNMLPQVQCGIVDCIVQKGSGDKNILRFLLYALPYSIVGINDDVFMTTHSMPSGSFLTAILNSFVNKVYTAMWYYSNVSKIEQPTTSGFLNDVVDYVYGDDKLNGVRKYQSVLNAITMKEYFKKLGMSFTDSLKGEIINEFQDLSTVTFLKRSFKYHYALGSVVAPLDLRTLYSGLSWLDGSKDQSVVLMDKLNAFQREIFLHETEYNADIQKLKIACEEKQIPLVILPPHYLINLYNKEPQSYHDLAWGGSKYI
jgi:hypothetical protein